MTLAPTWEELTSVAEPEIDGWRRYMPGFLLSDESWLTLLLLTVAFGAVVASIESANWVSEMPSLVAAGAIGLATGWLLANMRARALTLHLVGLATGFVISVALTMHTMRLEDPLLSSGLGARWSETWARFGEWLRASVEGGISSDPLPFVLLLVFGLWAMGYAASWAIFRWQNAWVALIPGGFAMLTNISYLPGQPAQEFIVYLFAAILLVARLHYVRQMSQWRAERTWRTPYLSFEVLTFSTWVGLLLIMVAWLVPTANNWGPLADAWATAVSPVSDRADRLGRLFIGVGSKRDQYIHSFGATLPLQGKVTLDEETLLMTVLAPELPNERPLYLRGTVYDEYSAQGWKVTDAATLPLLGTSVEAARFGTALTRAQLRQPIEVEVTLEETVARKRLFSAGDPITTDVDAKLLTDAFGTSAIGLVPESKVEAGETYVTVGSVSGAALERLLVSDRNYPPSVTERYLQLPDDLPPEVAALAAEVAGRLEQPYAVARKIEAFLRTEYPFDLSLATRPPRRDGVAHFLFDARSGYFDHHASAMAVMLRTLGIPARVAVGFALDQSDLDSETKSYEVTEANAWTWPEVYFAGLGWIEFNPTPAERLISRPGDDSELVTIAEGVQGVDDELEDVLLAELLEALAEGTGSSSSTTTTGSTGIIGEAIARVLTWASTVAVLLFGTFAAVRGTWAWWFRGLGRDGSRWAKLQLLTRWGGTPMRPNRTPLESASELEAMIGGRVDVTPLARAYAHERYGEHAQELDDDEADELRGIYTTVRNRLLGRDVRRWIALGRVPSAGGEAAAREA